ITLGVGECVVGSGRDGVAPLLETLAGGPVGVGDRRSPHFSQNSAYERISASCFSSSVHGSEERLATRFVKGLPPYLTPSHLTSNITTWDATTVCHHGRKVPLPGSSVLRSCSPNPLAHTEPLEQVPQGLGVSSVMKRWSRSPLSIVASGYPFR